MLNGRQSFFVDKISQLYIRESTNAEDTSSDSELSDDLKERLSYAEKLTSSKNIVDQRLLNLHLVMQTNDLGHSFGFDNDALINRNKIKRRWGVGSSSYSP